jgi:hypothetical protein
MDSTSPGAARSIYIGGHHGIRKPREDLSSQLCPHNRVKVEDWGVVAPGLHPCPNPCVVQTKEPSPRLARGRPTALGTDCRQLAHSAAKNEENTHAGVTEENRIRGSDLRTKRRTPEHLGPGLAFQG